MESKALPHDGPGSGSDPGSLGASKSSPRTEPRLFNLQTRLCANTSAENILRLFPQSRNLSILDIVEVWDMMNTDCCQADICRLLTKLRISLSDFEALSARESAIIDRFVCQWKHYHRADSPTLSEASTHVSHTGLTRSRRPSGTPSMLHSVSSYRSVERNRKNSLSSHSMVTRRSMHESVTAPKDSLEGGVADSQKGDGINASSIPEELPTDQRRYNMPFYARPSTTSHEKREVPTSIAAQQPPTEPLLQYPEYMNTYSGVLMDELKEPPRFLSIPFIGRQWELPKRPRKLLTDPKPVRGFFL